MFERIFLGWNVVVCFLCIGRKSGRGGREEREVDGEICLIDGGIVGPVLAGDQIWGIGCSRLFLCIGRKVSVKELPLGGRRLKLVGWRRWNYTIAEGGRGVVPSGRVRWAELMLGVGNVLSDTYRCSASVFASVLVCQWGLSGEMIGFFWRTSAEELLRLMEHEEGGIQIGWAGWSRWQFGHLKKSLVQSVMWWFPPHLAQVVGLLLLLVCHVVLLWRGGGGSIG
ncbi:Protein of unknown function [Gryllus bimaculatus]|nr:Protein of unknown function [Gryllus bimaculatus]